METKRIKWLIYTVLVGLIPVLSRMFAWGITRGGTLDFLTASDFIAFGLVLHISNINEIEHIADNDLDWKTIQNGCSIVFIALYSVLFTVTLIGGKMIDQPALLYCSLVLAAISTILSYSIYHRLVRLGGAR